MDLPAQVSDAAERWEARIAAMGEDERVKFLNELLAWQQVQLLQLYPD